MSQTGGAKYAVGVTRQRVAEYRDKGLTASEIARVLGISRAAVSQHLKRLTETVEQEQSA